VRVRTENSALLAHDFLVAVAKCVAATKRPLEATMMKSDPQLIGHTACRHGISIVQMAVAVLLLVNPVAAQTAQSCAEPAVAAKSNMSNNACKLKTSIGFGSLDEYPKWKAVDLGVYHDANAVRDAFRTTPHLIRIDKWADQMLNRITFLQTDTTLNLVLTTVSDLGFGEDGASLKDIYERASRLGLALCPAELGPALRLAYLDQPLGEYLRLAMQPVARSDGKATDFTVAKGLAGLLLIGDDVRDDLVLAGDTRMVFVGPDRAPYRSVPRTN
jgi:hypothetical protein